MQKYNSKNLVKFVSKIFEHAGSDNEESFIVADHLVDSNLVGHDSHGVIRVPQYLEWFDNGNINLNQKINKLYNPKPKFVIENNFNINDLR